MRTPSLLPLLLASMTASLTVSACGSAVMPTGDGGPDAGGCVLPNGSRCALGASCPAGDGCNTCRCWPGGLACTLRGCVDGGPPDVTDDVPGTCPPASMVRQGAACAGVPSTGCRGAIACSQCGAFAWTIDAPVCQCNAGAWVCSHIDCGPFGRCGNYTDGACTRPVACDAGTDAPVDAPADAATDAGTCAAMEARGEGLCPAILGYAWNGRACDTVGGCSCVGRDCGLLFRTMDACTTYYASCVTGPRTCVLPAGDCGTSAMCLGQNTCRTDVGLCVPPRGCTRDLVPYCGCDGATFQDSSTCPRRNYQHPGPCTGPTDGGMRGCTTTSDCPPSSVCEGLGCGTPDGMCVPLTRPCLGDVVPYCGCDGMTFTSSSSCANRRYAHRGACP